MRAAFWRGLTVGGCLLAATFFCTGCDSGDDDTAADTSGDTNAPAATEATLTGSWNGIRTPTGGTPVSISLHLDQDDDALTGDGEGAALTGSISGDSVEFTYTTGTTVLNSRTYTYTGNANTTRTTMQGTYESYNVVLGTINGTWSVAK